MVAQGAGPTLELQIPSGQTEFHIGERIPLRLTFQSPSDSGFLIVPYASIDVHGYEFDLDSFEVTPSTGWADPLAMWLARERVITGHGWPAQPFLKEKPVTLNVALNQWVRFDEPGTYTLKVLSHRVLKKDDAQRVDPLESNAIELHIVAATPEWQAGKLNSILATSARTGPATLGDWEDLRYLSTPAGIDVMTDQMRYLNYEIAHEIQMGLIGLPDSLRATAIASMMKRIEEPDFPISPQFFETMAFLHVAPGSTKESITEQMHAYEPALWADILAAIAKKEPPARAQTVQTLLFEGWALKVPELDAKIGPLLIASFADLDQRSQTDELMHHWDLLRSEALLPTLEELAKAPVQYTSVFDDVKSAALRRWYELDPVGARKEILEEIGTAAPRLSAMTLYFMPREPLPQFEPMWADAFLRTKDQQQATVLGSLMVEFGAGHATTVMQEELNATGVPYNACASHSLALAYLARFSPNQARSAFQTEFARDSVHCNGEIFRLIRQWTSVPEQSAAVLNEAALDALDNDNPRIVRDALEQLTLFGTKTDRQPILDHYAKWAEKWRSKAGELDQVLRGGLTADTHVPLDDAYEGGAYSTALLANQGWMPDDALRARVLANCVGEVMCGALQKPDNSYKPPYLVSLPNLAFDAMSGMRPSFAVAQFHPQSLDALDEKLRQFPRGTQFHLIPGSEPGTDQKKLEEQVHAIFAKEGMTLTTWPN